MSQQQGYNKPYLTIVDADPQRTVREAQKALVFLRGLYGGEHGSKASMTAALLQTLIYRYENVLGPDCDVKEKSG